MTQDTPVRAVARALDVLMVLAGGSKTLTDLANAADLSKSTAHRILVSLAHRHLVIQDETTGQYLLGPGCIQIAEAVTRGAGGLSVIGRSAMEALREETQETITLHIRVGVQRVCIAELPSAQPVRYTAGLGHLAPIHTGSAGKLLLAYMGEDARRELVGSTELRRLTGNTITDPAALEMEFAAIREKGCAVSVGERVVGAAAISAPIIGPGSNVTALSVLGPEARLSGSRIEELCPVVISAAESISQSLVGTVDSDLHTRRPDGGAS